MKKAKPSSIPLDLAGVLLKKGDTVQSTASYCEAKTHRGQVVSTLRGLVEVQHEPGCCDGDLPSHRTNRSAAVLWEKTSAK